MSTPTLLETPATSRIPVPAIRRAGGYEVTVAPGADWRGALSETLELLALRKLRLSVAIAPAEGGLALTGHLGATVVQACVITLAPVTTRIEVPVSRMFLDEMPEPQGEEVEIPEDDSLEPLGDIIDLGAVLAEALALNLPLYPRAQGVERRVVWIEL